MLRENQFFGGGGDLNRRGAVRRRVARTRFWQKRYKNLLYFFCKPRSAPQIVRLGYHLKRLKKHFFKGTGPLWGGKVKISDLYFNLVLFANEWYRCMRADARFGRERGSTTHTPTSMFSCPTKGGFSGESKRFFCPCRCRLEWLSKKLRTLIFNIMKIQDEFGRLWFWYENILYVNDIC